ncbi:MAG: hypothetical protein PUA93_05710 [Eubacteriales bacterium]|nr:hypothetical protein [Eubacteriales bacterium]
MKKKILALLSLFLILPSCSGTEGSTSSPEISSPEGSGSSFSSVEVNPLEKLFTPLAEGYSLEGYLFRKRTNANHESFRSVTSLSVLASPSSFAYFSYEAKLKANNTYPTSFSMDKALTMVDLFERGEETEEFNIIPSTNPKYQDESGSPLAVQAKLGLDNVVHETRFPWSDEEGNSFYPIFASSGFSSSLFAFLPLNAIEKTEYSSYTAYSLDSSNCLETEKEASRAFLSALTDSYASQPFDQILFLTQENRINKILAESETTSSNVTTSSLYVFNVLEEGASVEVPKAKPIEGTTYPELDNAYQKIAEGNFKEVDDCGLYYKSGEKEVYKPTRKLTMTCTLQSILYMPYIYSSTLSDYYQGIGSGYLLYDNDINEKVTPLSKGYYLHGEKFVSPTTYPLLSSVFFTKNENGHYVLSYQDEKYKHIFLDSKTTYYLMSMTGYGTESLDIEIKEDSVITTSFDGVERVTTTFTDIGTTTSAFTSEDVIRNSDDLTWKDMLLSSQYTSLENLLGSEANIDLIPTLGDVFSEASLLSTGTGTTLTFRLEYPLIRQSIKGSYLSSLVKQYQKRVENKGDWTITRTYNAFENTEDPYFLVEASYDKNVAIGESNYKFTLQGGYTNSSSHHGGYCFALIGKLTYNGNSD